MYGIWLTEKNKLHTTQYWQKTCGEIHIGKLHFKYKLPSYLVMATDMFWHDVTFAFLYFSYYTLVIALSLLHFIPLLHFQFKGLYKWKTLYGCPYFSAQSTASTCCLLVTTSIYHFWKPEALWFGDPVVQSAFDKHHMIHLYHVEKCEVNQALDMGQTKLIT